MVDGTYAGYIYFFIIHRIASFCHFYAVWRVFCLVVVTKWTFVLKVEKQDEWTEKKPSDGKVNLNIWLRFYSTTTTATFLWCINVQWNRMILSMSCWCNMYNSVHCTLHIWFNGRCQCNESFKLYEKFFCGSLFFSFYLVSLWLSNGIENR